MNKIALIIPYFGKFNNYFQFWISSAGNNKDIDFLIFTDDNREFQYPECNNIKWFDFSLSKVRELAKDKLSRFSEEIHLNTPYKLCDFKPFYGIVFEDYLKGYDFWGHCDVDLIFGRIRKFVTDDVLASYDRIYSRGHLSIYRNTQDVNTFFLKSENNSIGIPSYKEVLSSNKSYSFDEWPGLSKLWKSLCPDRMYDQIDFDDIYILKKEFVSSQKVKSDIEKSNFVFLHNNSCLYRYYKTNNTISKEETLYVHFQKRNLDVLTTNSSNYIIVPNRFVDNQEISIEFLEKEGRKHLLYLHGLKIRYNNLKKKLHLG